MAGRGRLSIIEQLPDDFDDIVLWAATELRERKQLQIDILSEFNKRLKARGDEIGVDVPEITSSSFNRYSVRQAILMRDLEEAREITKVVVDRLEPGQTDDLTIGATELIKMIVVGISKAKRPDQFDSKEVQELAAALRAAAQAQSVSADRRRKLEAEMAAKTEKALEHVVKKKGMTRETAEDIKRQILGIGG